MSPDAVPGAYGIRVIGLADPRAGATPIDGQWLVEYDPTRPGVDPLGRPMTAHLVCTDDPARAQVFATHAAAHAAWTAESGQPYPRDKPLTAFHITIEPLPHATEVQP